MNSTDNHVLDTIATIPNDHFLLQPHTNFHPTDNHVLDTIATIPNYHFLLQPHTYFNPKDNRSLATVVVVVVVEALSTSYGVVAYARGLAFSALPPLLPNGLSP